MIFRARPRPDPLAGLRAIHRQCLLEAARSSLAVIDGDYRPVFALTTGGRYSHQLITALIARGLLERPDANFVTITPKGRSRARIIRHRAAVGVKLLENRL